MTHKGQEVGRSAQGMGESSPELWGRSDTHAHNGCVGGHVCLRHVDVLAPGPRGRGLG